MTNVSKAYPYPVLGNNDDIDALFEYEAEPMLLDEAISIKVRCRLRHSTISNLIINEQAAFCMDIWCVKTKYRKCMTFMEDSIEINLPSNLLRDRVEMAVYVTAKTDISGYDPIAVNPDMDMGAVDINTGDILADGGIKYFNADKYFDPLSQGAGSFIKVRQGNTEDGPVSISMEEEDIAIIIPKNQYNIYKQIATAGKLGSSYAHATYVMPVLMNAINKYEDEEFRDFRWSVRLASILDTRKINPENSFTAAQKILALPYDRSNNNLISELSNGDDYD